jgi:AcrR family transcriptional regulator
MPPEERRAAIVDATLPLLLDRGRGVTTRQIAEAAGVAEGTIFRAFPDKEAVVDATLASAFDPGPTERAIAAIDPDLPFDAQLVEAVGIIQRRLSVIWRLLSFVGAKPPARPPDSPALVELLARHDHRVRLPAAVAARRLRALTLASSHPAAVDVPLTPEEIVDQLLHGIAVRPDRPDDHTHDRTDETRSTEAAPC